MIAFQVNAVMSEKATRISACTYAAGSSHVARWSKLKRTFLIPRGGSLSRNPWRWMWKKSLAALDLLSAIAVAQRWRDLGNTLDAKTCSQVRCDNL